MLNGLRTRKWYHLCSNHTGRTERAEEFIDLIAQYGSDEVDGIHSRISKVIGCSVRFGILMCNSLLDQRAASAQARAMGAKIARGIVAAAA